MIEHSIVQINADHACRLQALDEEAVEMVGEHMASPVTTPHVRAQDMAFFRVECAHQGMRQQRPETVLVNAE